MTLGGEGRWVLHFHTSAGYGDTWMRFRTRAEARRYRNEIQWNGSRLVFYPICRAKDETWSGEWKARAGLSRTEGGED